MNDSASAIQQNRKTVDEWCSEYERIRSEYSRYTKKLESLLIDLLAAKGLGYHLIESRTKDLTSFREKIFRASKVYTNPLSDLTDLSGLRIIAYYQDDADFIGKLIKSEFDIDYLNSVEHSPDGAEFGYRSAHYVVRLSDTRAQLLEWAGLADIKAEIQVRTVLQHAWAAISHKLQYKREEDVPAQLRRKLFRLSALFELVDDEFVSLRDASGSFTQEIDSQLASGDRNIRIDYVSLSQFVEKSPLVAELCAFAAEVGFNFATPDGPEDSDPDTDAVSDLIQIATLARLNTIAQIEAALTASSVWAKEYLRAQYYNENDSSKKDEWYVTPPFICELLLIRALISHLRPGHLLKLGWDSEIVSQVFRIAKEFKPGQS